MEFLWNILKNIHFFVVGFFPTLVDFVLGLIFFLGWFYSRVDFIPVDWFNFRVDFFRPPSHLPSPIPYSFLQCSHNFMECQNGCKLVNIICIYIIRSHIIVSVFFLKNTSNQIIGTILPIRSAAHVHVMGSQVPSPSHSFHLYSIPSIYNLNANKPLMLMVNRHSIHHFGVLYRDRVLFLAINIQNIHSSPVSK